MIKHTELDLARAPLGKKSSYINTYTPSLLFPVPRMPKREEIGIQESLPFKGYDIWNAFELSWLNQKGKPIVAIAEFVFPCTTPNIIESKSFKLYLNSLNSSKFESVEQVQALLQTDLSKCVNGDVHVRVYLTHRAPIGMIRNLDGICLDDLDIEFNDYCPNIEYLITEEEVVEETLQSDLLKSNCLVTGQPDWASIKIKYYGKKISHTGLLRYIVSLRDHNEFHEQCVERIFMDILTMCRPQKLSVFARYTRRGGLDINPFRSNYIDQDIALNTRLIRQ